MGHQQAISTQAVERYLLDEMTGPQREEFEDHFFTCAECADAVRTGAELSVNARALLKDKACPPVPGRTIKIPVRPGMRQIWFQRGIGALAAMLLLGTAAIYQKAASTKPQLQASVEHWKIAPDRRGGVSIETRKLQPGKLYLLDLELPVLQPMPSYRVEIRNESGNIVLTEENAPTHEGAISVPLPSTLGAGIYRVVVGGTNASHYRLQLTEKGMHDPD